MKISFQKASGNLIMNPEPGDREFMRRRRAKLCTANIENWWLRKQGLAPIKPESVGALTSAPLIIGPDGKVYGYMEYQVRSFLEELAAGRPVVWIKGD